ncbi:hypothetical protein R1sor_011810 [Riccia sorocarpa]|uniref:Uncharacterized protein n=1 Tax=Riccia sorocarpa TaxID=122646 RepID=A0ABD3I3U9_9MARC
MESDLQTLAAQIAMNAEENRRLQALLASQTLLAASNTMGVNGAGSSALSPSRDKGNENSSSKLEKGKMPAVQLNDRYQWPLLPNAGNQGVTKIPTTSGVPPATLHQVGMGSLRPTPIPASQRGHIIRNCPERRNNHPVNQQGNPQQNNNSQQGSRDNTKKNSEPLDTDGFQKVPQRNSQRKPHVPMKSSANPYQVLQFEEDKDTSENEEAETQPASSTQMLPNPPSTTPEENEKEKSAMDTEAEELAKENRK